MDTIQTENAHQVSTARTTSTARRALTVVMAVAAAAIAFVIEQAVVSEPFTVEFSGGAAQTVGIGSVLVSAAVSSLLGWAAVAFLEKVAAGKAKLLWTILAVAVLLISFGGPLGAVAATSTKVCLVFLHVLVGAILISRLPRT